MKVYKLLKKWWFEIGTDMYRDLFQMLWICDNNEKVIEQFNSFDWVLLITILNITIIATTHNIYNRVIDCVRQKIKVFNLFNYFTAHHMRTEKDFLIQTEVDDITKHLFNNKSMYKHLRDCIWLNRKNNTFTLYCFYKKLFFGSNIDHHKLITILYDENN